MGLKKVRVKQKVASLWASKRQQDRVAEARRGAPWGRLAFIAVAVAVMAVAGSASPCLALDNATTRATLKGLPAVYLMVEDLRLEIEEEGFTRNEMDQIARKLLESAGVRLIPEAEWLDMPGSPWLYLYAHVMRREFVEERVYVFNISVELKQKATLARAPDGEPVFVTTWSRSLLGKSGYLEDIRKGVEICLEDFVEAFRSVNGP